MLKNKKRKVYSTIKAIVGDVELIQGWSENDAPSGDFLQIRYGSIKASDNTQWFDEDVYLDAYTKDEARAKFLIERVLRNITKPRFSDALLQDGLVHIGNDEIRDLTFIADDKCEAWKNRAQTTLTFRYNSDSELNIDDEDDIIKEVEGSGDIVGAFDIKGGITNA